MAKEKRDLWQWIVAILFVLLGVYFVVSQRGSINSYKKDIRLLETDISTLTNKLEESVPKDSILHYLNEQETFNQRLENYTKQIQKLKESYEESKFDFIFDLPADSNIIILTRWLSEKNPD